MTIQIGFNNPEAGSNFGVINFSAEPTHSLTAWLTDLGGLQFFHGIAARSDRDNIGLTLINFLLSASADSEIFFLGNSEIYKAHLEVLLSSRGSHIRFEFQQAKGIEPDVSEKQEVEKGVFPIRQIMQDLELDLVSISGTKMSGCAKVLKFTIPKEDTIIKKHIQQKIFNWLKNQHNRNIFVVIESKPKEEINYSKSGLTTSIIRHYNTGSPKLELESMRKIYWDIVESDELKGKSDDIRVKFYIKILVQVLIYPAENSGIHPVNPLFTVGSVNENIVVDIVRRLKDYPQGNNGSDDVKELLWAVLAFCIK